MELAQTRRTLSSLAEAGVLSYQPARRTRGVVMLDEQPATRLRIRPEDLARRAALEQRKLREMISLLLHGELLPRLHPRLLRRPLARRHLRQVRQLPPAGRRRARRRRAPPLDAPRDLDRFIMKHVPAGLDLEEELAGQSRTRKRREAAEAPATSTKRTTARLHRRHRAARAVGRRAADGAQDSRVRGAHGRALRQGDARVGAARLALGQALAGRARPALDLRHTFGHDAGRDTALR